MFETLEDRMKYYERETNYTLTPKVPVVGRVDGKGFSKFTRQLKLDSDSPWDGDFVAAMTVAGKAACEEIQGCQLAYIQSDEITFLVTDTASENTQSYFGYKTRKMNSIVASTVALEFYAELIFRRDDLVDSRPRFDSRFWNVTPDEVVNVFIWRQQDAMRNSVQMWARHHFSHKQVDGKSVAQMKEMLREIDADWDELPEDLQRGILLIKREFTEPVTFTVCGQEKTTMVTRKRWVAETAPLFVENKGLIAELL